MALAWCLTYELCRGSYRELLSTADSIIQMEGHMKQVELHLGETSRRCNTDRMGRSARNASKLSDNQDRKGQRVKAFHTDACVDILQIESFIAHYPNSLSYKAVPM